MVPIWRKVLGALILAIPSFLALHCQPDAALARFASIGAAAAPALANRVLQQRA